MSLKQIFSNVTGAALLTVATAIAPSPTIAHEAAAARHGGVVQSAADLSFELVATTDGAAIYVLDHGKEFDTANFSGKLTALNGTQKSEAELRPAGGNKLEAKGLSLRKGARAVAVLRTDGAKTITVRFAPK